MKTLLERVLRVWWMTALAVIVLCFVGCKTQYVPVETTKTEVVKELEIQRDSIYVLDSVFVRQANDTVYLTKWRVEYKEALRIDTLHIVERDSINHVVEVERPLAKMQQLKMVMHWQKGLRYQRIRTLPCLTKPGKDNLPTGHQI